jgi:hypothetical protein
LHLIDHRFKGHPSSIETYVRMLRPDDTAEQRQITTCHGSIPTYTVHPSYPLPPAGGHVNGFLHACTAGRIYVQLVIHTTNDGTCVRTIYWIRARRRKAVLFTRACAYAVPNVPSSGSIRVGPHADHHCSCSCSRRALVNSSRGVVRDLVRLVSRKQC